MTETASGPAWIPIARNYPAESKSLALGRSLASNQHPLLPRQRKQQPPSETAKAATTTSKQPAVKVNVTSKSSLNRISVTTVTGSNPLDPLSSMGVGPSLQQTKDDDEDEDVDPLSSSVPFDPLTSSLGTSSSSKVETHSQNMEQVRQTAKDLLADQLPSVGNWHIRKQKMLREYAVSEAQQITVSSSSIGEVAGIGLEDGSATRHLEKYDNRLASLERRQTSTSDTMQLSQKEYEAHVQRLSDQLNKCWANDERVGSLKVVIQLSKLLSDTNYPLFYPSMFVLVTNVLERFGQMVFKRLLMKAEEALPSELPPHFTSKDVLESTKETCRNWFYKVACIRDLLPRTYVEIALLQCYRFITEAEYMPSILTKLGGMMRGLGDPLVSLYCRTYLAVSSSQLAESTGHSLAHSAAHSMSMLKDTLYCLTVVRDQKANEEAMKLLQSSSKHTGLSCNSYTHLLSPAMEWLMRCVGHAANKETFQSTLQLYREHSGDCMVLKHIIDSFDASHYCHVVLGMAALIKSATSSSVNVVDVCASLGKQLAIHPPPEEQRKELLAEVWKLVGKETASSANDLGAAGLLSYVKCTAAWLDVVQKFYSQRELAVLLKGLAGRLDTYINAMASVSTGGVDLPESVLEVLQVLLTSLVGQSSTFGTAVLTSEHLLKILDCFKGSKKVEICKEILEAFKAMKRTTADAVLINALFDIGRAAHDSVEASLTADSVQRHIVGLLCSFIDSVDFGRDLEQQLNFYVECRAAFCNLDLIKDKLVICVASLVIKAYRIVRGKHTRKTSTFVKAGLAYCHITIPSIRDAFRKLQLLLMCAEVSLMNNCLPQTDAFLKASVSLIPTMPTSCGTSSGAQGTIAQQTEAEQKLLILLKQLLSLLVVLPGHPEHGPFYILHGLLNAVPRYQWQAGSAAQTQLYISMLALLCSLSQKQLPYRMGLSDAQGQGHGAAEAMTVVMSNDQLYDTNSPAYRTELLDLTQSCVEDILKQLVQLGERAETTAKIGQAKGCLQVANLLAANMDLSQRGVPPFLLKLLSLANKQRSFFTRSDLKYFTNTVDFLMTKLTACSSNSGDVVAALKGLS